MKIVILDGFTLNPGDLDWAPVEELGEVVYYERTAPEEVVARVGFADAVLTNKVKLTRETINHLPNLRYIGVTATGYNIVDVATARAKGITVTNVPAYSTESVAQHTFALVLELATHVGLHSRSVQDGDWAASPDFSYWRRPLVELHGRTFGIVGLGKIGQAVARIALAMGMRVIASHKHPQRDAMQGVTFVDLPTVFQESDVVSLHCPLSDSNKGFVNREMLGKMKKSAFFINVSRGGLVNEIDLADALNSGRIAGAGLDVLTEEPAAAENPLVQARNCIITPHIAWATQAARRRLMGVVVENLKAFLDGKELNRIQDVKMDKMNETEAV